MGPMIIGSYREQICLCEWIAGKEEARDQLTQMMDAKFVIGSSKVNTEAMRQLDEYFAKKRKMFEVPLFICGTELLQDLWMEISMIPYGSFATFSKVSMNIGLKKTSRSVGKWVYKNSICIFIPTHWVISTRDIENRGYMGDNSLKRRLLILENTEIR